MKNIQRGNYGEIKMSSLNTTTQKQIKNLFNEVCKSEKVDEHGNWEFGAEFDNKGRGYAINWDLYAYGKDYYSKRALIIIQIRKWEKQRKNGFANIKKSYFLLGRNEDNTAFAHPVESRVIHHAIKVDADVIKSVQSWIFGCDYKKVLRHGDVAAIPVSKVAGTEIAATEIMIQPEDGSASHLLKCDKIMVNGSMYAKNIRLIHLPGTHPDVNGEGWFKIVIGKRSDYYDFATPTID